MTPTVRLSLNYCKIVFRSCRWRRTRKRRQNRVTASTPSTARSAARTFWRTPMLSAVPLQQGRAGRGPSGLRGGRGVRGRAMAAGTGACAQAGNLSTGPYQTRVHTEGQRQTQAAGHLPVMLAREVDDRAFFRHPVAWLGERRCISSALCRQGKHRGSPLGRRRSRRRVSAVRALGHNSSSPRPRHNASGKYTSPNRRERSTRTPFRRTGAVNCPLLSSNSGASSGAPISRRASARASIRTRSSGCAAVCWITRRPTRTLRTKHQ